MAQKEEHLLKAGQIPLEEKLSEAAHAFKQTAEQILEVSRQTVGDKTADVQDALASGVKSATSLIKKYPLESALVCFGVGCLVGTLLKRRE